MRLQTKRLCSVVAIGIAGLLVHAPALADGHSTRPVFTESLCFVVQNPGDPQPSDIYGVRYHLGRVTPKSDVIILVHGSATSHVVWDFAPGYSVANNLARAGYVVIAYDRLGFGQSPYLRPKGFGHLLTLRSQQEMLHQIVGQVRAGAYALSRDGKCPSQDPHAVAASSRIILIGHSAGGAIVGGYAGRYRDVAAVVQTAWSNQGPSLDALAQLTRIVAPQLAAGQDYVYFFDNRPDCERFAFYMPGMDPDLALADRVCNPNNFVASPAPDFTDDAAVSQTNNAFITQVGPGLPVLLASADHDFVFPTDRETADAQYWKDNCGCDLTSWVQTDAGHVVQLQESMPTFTAEVISWLRSRRDAPGHGGPS
jgi:pimeloyl-ACP methyl ester carboxylesterase